MTKNHKEMTDAEEREFIEDLESGTNPIVSVMTPERRRDIAAFARATINASRYHYAFQKAI